MVHFVEFLKSFLYYTFVFFITLYILLVAFSPEKMMDVIGFRTFIVLSDSMEPKLNVNDMILLRSVTEDDLDVGDIITFEVYIPEIKSDVFVTHYIGAIDQQQDTTIYKTRRIGLKEDESDNWVDENGDPILITFRDIEGKYLFKVPFIGYIQQAFSNKVIVVLVLINSGVIYLIFKMIRKKPQDKTDNSL